MKFERPSLDEMPNKKALLETVVNSDSFRCLVKKMNEVEGADEDKRGNRDEIFKCAYIY